MSFSQFPVHYELEHFGGANFARYFVLVRAGVGCGDNILFQVSERAGFHDMDPRAGNWSITAMCAQFLVVDVTILKFVINLHEDRK